MSQPSMHSKATPRVEPRPDRPRRAVQSDEDRLLGRINIAIWILVAGCFMVAAAIWAVLLRGLP